MLKLITIVGTRPEIIRLSRVIYALDNSKSIDHILVHTGQNYDFELNEIFFDDLEIRKPDIFLESAGETPSETIGNIFIKIDKVYNKINPDAVLVLGDTNSCLCVIPAKKRKIPIFHMEAGNRCFDQRVPEETNRKIVDHVSDINLTYSDISRQYLILEGLAPDRVIRVGSPMFEVIEYYKRKILKSDILKKLKLNKSKYFLVSIHREENIENEKGFKLFFETLEFLSTKYNAEIIVSTHPRTRKKLKQLKIKPKNSIKFLKPLSFSDYNNLQSNALVTLSDSGTISEESSILNFKAINIREAHERPEAMEEATCMLVGLDHNKIIEAIDHLLSTNYDKSSNKINLVKDYSYKNVSEKIVRIIISYTNYINRIVWQKNY